MTDAPNARQPIDKFTLPGDIPDIPSDTFPGDTADARGYAASHPAGRGWVQGSRDLGIPSEHESTRVSAPDPYGQPDRTVRIEQCFPDGTPDDPVAAIGCGGVFDTARRVRFLDHLAFKGNVRAAAALVGVSHETVYRRRRQDAAFAQLWDAALVHARSYGESALAARALDGVEVPIVYRGEIVGYRRHYDTRLLLAHLARLDRRVAGEDDQARAANARAERFDELLAAYAGHETPADFARAAGEVRDPRQPPAAPDLPPSRADYVAWRRGEALDAVAEDLAAAAGEEGAGEGDGGARGGAASDTRPDPQAREEAEAEALAEATESGGVDWDRWHHSALATVRAFVGAGDEGEQVGKGAEGADAAPADLPYEIKSRPAFAPTFAPAFAKARNSVTTVNPAGLAGVANGLSGPVPQKFSRGWNRSAAA